MVETTNQRKQSIHLMNRDIVQSCPKGLEILAHTAKCSIHGMYLANRLITVQGHPEFNERITKELLTLRNATGIIDDNTFQDAMNRVDKHHDGIVVARAFLRFLLNADRQTARGAPA